MKISIVVPVFNEEKHILNVLSDIKKTKLNIIVVNDGSLDKTKLNITNSKIKNITLLNHGINLGKGAALKTGCEYAFSNGSDAVILMDSDGQHDSKDIPKFIDKLELGYDMVFGSRNQGLEAPLDRYIGNKVNSVLISVLFGIYVSDILCGFRAFTRSAYNKIKWNSVGYGVETEMVLRTKKMKLKHCEVPVTTIYYDSFKGVSVFDAFGVLLNILGWRIKL